MKLGRPRLIRGKSRYNVPNRVKFIFEEIWRAGGVRKGSANILSAHTGRTMTYAGVRKYLKEHGYKIVMGPYLSDLKGNLLNLNQLDDDNDD